MKRVSKLYRNLALGATAIVVPFVTILSTSCANEESEPQPTQISMQNGDNVQFCNGNLMETLVCAYPFQISGDYKDGDILETTISKQTINDEEVSFLSLDSSCQEITMAKNITDFSIIVLGKDQFRSYKTSIDFVVTFRLYRGSEVIYKQVQKDLSFVNATPTNPELFDYDINLSAGVKRLKGFKDEDWVDEQLTYCDTLLIPSDVTEIADNAFIDLSYIQRHTSIPENITSLILDKTHGQSPTSLHTIGSLAFADASQLTGELYIPSSVEKINALAFDRDGFSKITLTNPIKDIGDGAFANNSKCTTVDLSPYSYVPGTHGTQSWTGIAIFSGVNSNVNNILYISSSNLKNMWLAYLSGLACDEIVMWTVKEKQA